MKSGRSLAADVLIFTFLAAAWLLIKEDKIHLQTMDIQRLQIIIATVLYCAFIGLFGAMFTHQLAKQRAAETEAFSPRTALQAIIGFIPPAVVLVLVPHAFLRASTDQTLLMSAGTVVLGAIATMIGRRLSEI